jgi:copper resistance protein B
MAADRLRAATVILGAVGALLASPAPGQAQSDRHAPKGHDMMTWEVTGFVLSELLEYVPTAAERPVRYDLVGWVGGPVHRVWAKAEGDRSTRSGEGDTELQLLYGRLISPFWDLQLGLRGDIGYGKGEAKARLAAALGLQGLAPGWFEVEPTVFVSHRGDVWGNLTAAYDLLLTQRLVAEPRFETEAAVQAVPEFGVGSGITEIDLGLRIRYEIWRELAPYVGVSWRRKVMETADLARAAGAPVGELAAVAGLRLWY